MFLLILEIPRRLCTDRCYGTEIDVYASETVLTFHELVTFKYLYIPRRLRRDRCYGTEIDVYASEVVLTFRELVTF